MADDRSEFRNEGRAPIPMRRLQVADQWLGLLVCTLLQPLRWLRRLQRKRPVDAEARRVLAIKFWGIGSLQLLTPAVRTLRTRYPRAELVLLTLRGNRDCAERLQVFDRVLVLDVDGGWSSVFARIARLLLALRRERFDQVFDFEFFTRFSAVVSVLTGADRLHGFATSRVWRGGFHEAQAPFNRYWHVARNFRVLSGGEDGTRLTSSDLDPVAPGRAERARVRALLPSSGSTDTGYAVLNPNAGSLSLERRWPAENFAALAQKLIDEDGFAVALVGTADELTHVERVAHAIGRPDRVAVLAGRLGIGELAALLSECALFVSNDSGPMHLGAALGAPTVGLFGPETPVMYAPLGLRTRVLYRPPSCSPCINVHDNKVASCIHGQAECLVAIEVDEVHAAARGLLSDDELREVVLRPQTSPTRAPSPKTEPA